MATTDITEQAAHIYVIGAPNRPVKVGHSQHPDRRLKGLQVSNVDRLSILHSVECRDAEKLFAERYAHALLWPRRISGEWFDVTPEQAITAVDLAVSGTKAGRLPPGTTNRIGAGNPATRTILRGGFVDVIGARATPDQIAGALRYRDMFDAAESETLNRRPHLVDHGHVEALGVLHGKLEAAFCKAAVTLLVRTIGFDECVSDLPGSRRQVFFMRRLIKDILPHILRLTADAAQDRGNPYPSAIRAQAA